MVGTGDLSELALGFCTFAGDHIAMYNVNASVPKTLVRRLVAWVAEHQARAAEERAVLRGACSTRPVSPELVPPAADGAIAPADRGDRRPLRAARLLPVLLRCAWAPGRGRSCSWPSTPSPAATTRPRIRRWLRVFLERFFDQQFKRSVMPDGPKVGSVSLSPRGDWRMPSDAFKAAWLAELDAAP